MTARCWLCGRPRGPSPDGLGSHCRRKLATHHTTTPRPAARPGHTQPALEEITVTETTPTVGPAIEDRTARDDLYVIAADHYRDGEEADALINQHTADVQRARDEQFAAWLGQKAREFPTDRSRQESTPDYLARLADKVRRGAIR